MTRLTSTVRHRSRRVAAIFSLALGLLGGAGASLGDASAASAVTGSTAFCHSLGALYATTEQMATLWPVMTSIPSPAQATALVIHLEAMGAGEFGEMSITAPTAAIKTSVAAMNTASLEQLAEARVFSPDFNSSKTPAAEARYKSVFNRDAAVVRQFFSSHASALMGYCRGYDDARLVDYFAVTTTSDARGIAFAEHAASLTPALLTKAAEAAGHYVLFVDVSGHGAAAIAHYKVASITTMVNACTTVPSSTRANPASIPC